MGVELELYRARIGRYACRRSHTEKKLTPNSLSSVGTCAALFTMAITLGLISGALVGAVASSQAAETLLSFARIGGGALLTTPEYCSCLDELDLLGNSQQPCPWKTTTALNYTVIRWNWNCFAVAPGSAPILTTLGSFFHHRAILLGTDENDLFDLETYCGLQMGVSAYTNLQRISQASEYQIATLEGELMAYLPARSGTSLLMPQLECLQELSLAGSATCWYCLDGRHSPVNLVMEGYHWNFSGLLFLAGDIELNPGPIEKDDLESALKLFKDSMSQDNEQALKAMNDNLSAKIMGLCDCIQKMADTLTNMQGELGEIKAKLIHHEKFIEDISDRQAEMDSKLQHLEEIQERQEQRSRRDNVILYNVPETDNETFEDSENKFLETVNDVLPNLLECKDVKRSHRIGKTAPGKVRPLIACMNRSSDKYTILRARAEFKQKGIGVSADRSVKQRQELRVAREAGFLGLSDGISQAGIDQGGGRSGRDRYLTRSLTRIRERTSLS